MNLFFYLQTFILNYSFIVILIDHIFCTFIKTQPFVTCENGKIPERSRSVLGWFYCISRASRTILTGSEHLKCFNGVQFQLRALKLQWNGFMLAHGILNYFFNATTCPLWTSWSPLPVVAEV
jgi:hypothetical protein